MKEIELQQEELKAISDDLSSSVCPRPTIMRMPTSRNEADTENFTSETEEKPVMEKKTKGRLCVLVDWYEKERLVNLSNLDRDSCYRM
eukprot:gene9482-17214_t